MISVHRSNLISASVIRNHRKARNSEPRRTLAHPPRREQDRQPVLWSYFWPHAHHPALCTCTRDLSFGSPRVTTQTSLPSEAGWEAGRRGQVGNDSQKDLRTSTHYLAHSAPRSLKRQHDLQEKKHPGVTRPESSFTLWTTRPFPLICKAGIIPSLEPQKFQAEMDPSYR